MNETLHKELKKWGLKEIPYQVDYLTNPAYITPKEIVVLAAGTSAGKTKTTILKLELFYKIKTNKNKLTLIVPASKTILRDNFENDLDNMNEQYKLSFDYRVVKDKKEIENALKDKVQVIICLPQTLIKNHKLLPNLEMFVLDEAHQWYFKKTIQNILKHTKPKQTLLLTGTPSRFIEKGGFLFKFVPVMELFELGLVSNVKMEVVSSSYDFKRTDWLGTFGPLREGKTNSKKQAEDALLSVCNEMIKKLKNPIKGLHSINNITSNGVGKLFNSLNKTIIYTHSRKQATNFYNTLNTNKDLSGKVLLSHSENDKNSEEFKKFQINPEYFILIAVDRGRLGFNMPELFNIVDFTMTQSLDMLLQMYGRLLRKSDVNPNKTKIYFKVATKNTADYFVDLMTAMLCLTNLEWYSKYNGKNMGGIRIPKVLNGRRTNTKSNTTSGGSTTTNRRTRPYISIEQLGIPLDLNFFKQDIFHSSNSLFDTVAWTTLDDVRKEFFNIINRKEKGYWEIEENVISEAIKLDENGERVYKKVSDFQKNCVKGYSNALEMGILYTKCNFEQTRINKTVEEVKNELKKIGKITKTQLRKLHPKLYSSAGNYDLLIDYYSEVADVRLYQPKKVLEKLIKSGKTYKKCAEELGLTPAVFKTQCNHYGIYKKRDAIEIGNIQGTPILCYNYSTKKFLKEYPSQNAAAKDLGLSGTASIKKSLDNEGHGVGGGSGIGVIPKYFFKYKSNR